MSGKSGHRIEHTIFFKIFLKSSIFAKKWGAFLVLDAKSIS